MATVATYQEIYELLERVPAASLSWVDGIVAARLSMTAATRFIETMSRDADSPLRAMENEVLGDEIRKLNLACGTESVNRSSTTKFNIKLRAVLSSSEQQRVLRIVSAFCHPSFETSKRFGKNGHAVMNAVRRVLTGYGNSRIPSGASVVEVGPDVANWMLSPSPSAWAGDRVSAYSAARPIKTPRDGARMTWARLAAEMVYAREIMYDSDTVKKTKIFVEMRDKVFPGVSVPSSGVVGEYMLSYDSNYDIKFSDMPVAMALSGARAWYGTMVRAKGLTSVTKLKDGKLPLMGVNYRVDWVQGRIDFRHPECNAFGYSHDVYEYIKYEERHGYTWTTPDCDYIYTKGPETTDELLFFSVVRVPKLCRMYEPRFTENPRAGMLRLHSLWGDGEEKGGMPTQFVSVDFFVDSLNFWKVLEKRRALDFKGDISISLSLVRSTNVKFYYNGTPISAEERIAARLATATAIVVEALVHEQRLRDNDLFEVAMYQFDMSVTATSWLNKLLGSVLDMKVVTGHVISSIHRNWCNIRSTVIDGILRPLKHVRVGCEEVEPHVKLRDEDVETVSYGQKLVANGSECLCAEIADLRAALLYASADKVKVLSQYLKNRLDNNNCNGCLLPDVLEEVKERDNSVASVNSPSETSSDHDSSETDYSEVAVSDINELTIDTFDEFIKLETYLLDNNLRECRVDYDTICRSGPLTNTTVLACTTGRTRHAILEFSNGICVKILGEKSTYSAIYDPKDHVVKKTRVFGDAIRADVKNGYYYSCNRMDVYNSPELIQAVEYAKVYGKIETPRASYQVTLGVPGAGKTYTLMSEIARRWKSVRGFNFLVLAVTNASVKAAIKYGKQFGIDLDMLTSRVMTLDKYLMHAKFPADYLCVDEFPMVHIAKVDAAVAISGAKTVQLFGDARQIPYDPFCAEFKLYHSTLFDTVPEKNIVFLPKTHRLSRDVCAMWIDMYPALYPCDCCNLDTKGLKTLTYETAKDISHVKFDETVRYHTYLRDDRDDLRTILGMRQTKEELRALPVGGLATVHEDQGSTHDHVITVRLTPDYDKNASARNPSLFNRLNYVLTDTTRHTRSYHYISLSDERDLIMKRIDLSNDSERLAAVDGKTGYLDISISSMLKQF